MCKAQQQASPEAPIARVATLMWCWYGSNLDIRVQLVTNSKDNANRSSNRYVCIYIKKPVKYAQVDRQIDVQINIHR